MELLLPSVVEPPLFNYVLLSVKWMAPNCIISGLLCVVTGGLWGWCYLSDSLGSSWCVTVSCCSRLLLWSCVWYSRLKLFKIWWAHRAELQFALHVIRRRPRILIHKELSRSTSFSSIAAAKRYVVYEDAQWMWNVLTPQHSPDLDTHNPKC